MVQAVTESKAIDKFPVKLVITEIMQSEKTKCIRKALSPIASFIPTLSQEYGMFHTALIIGPWYLEWYFIVVFLLIHVQDGFITVYSSQNSIWFGLD
jgi:hypothetical protein